MRFEHDGTVWEIHLDGNVITTRTSTKRKRGPEVPREYADVHAAKDAYESLVNARLAAGFQADEQRCAGTGRRRSGARRRDPRRTRRGRAVSRLRRLVAIARRSARRADHDAARDARRGQHDRLREVQGARGAAARETR